MGRAAGWVVDEVVGAGWDGQGMGHGDTTVEGLNKGGVPGGHLAAAGLGDEGHGEFGGFGGGVNGEADMGREFGSD